MPPPCSRTYRKVAFRQSSEMPITTPIPIRRIDNVDKERFEDGCILCVQRPPTACMLAWLSSSRIISCARGIAALEMCLNCAVSEVMLVRFACTLAGTCAEGRFAKLCPCAIVWRSLVRSGNCTSRAAAITVPAPSINCLIARKSPRRENRIAA